MGGDSLIQTSPTLLSQLKTPENTAAWSQFDSIYGPVIFFQCRKAGLQDADARNVTQEVLLRVAASMPQFIYDRRRGRFRAWLFTITRNELHRFLSQRRGREQSLEGRLPEELADIQLPDSLKAFEEQIDARIFELAWQRVQDCCDEQTWQVFEQLWQADRSPAEIAAACGRGPDWVYRLKYRVVHKLKAEVHRLLNTVSETIPADE